MIFVLYIAIALLVGRILASQRTGFLERIILTASVFIGGFMGGFCGRSICLFILHLEGSGDSRSDMPRVVAATIFGFIFGSVVVPTLALFLTKPKNK